MCRETSLKSYRMTKLLDLMDGGLVTADQIAIKLRVSTRTVYRYVDILRRDGAPIMGEAGIGYMLRPRAPTAEVHHAN